MVKKSFTVIFATIAILLCIASTFTFGETYNDIIDEITNAKKETIYNTDLNAPFAKDKCGVLETINPESGAVSVNYDMFSLDGRAGSDIFKLSLNYSPANAKAKEETTTYINSENKYINALSDPSDFFCSRYAFGAGWSISFPYVETIDDLNKTNTYIHLENGTVYKKDSSSNGLENYDLNDISFSDTIVEHHGKTSKYQLVYSDGTVYYFDSYGYPIEKTDRFSNSVEYFWQEIDGIKCLYEIEDNCGHCISIGYSQNNITISMSDRVYTLLLEENEEGAKLLKSITDPMNRVTLFEYSETDTEFNFYPDIVSALVNKYYLLTDITYPTGISTKYTYTKGTKWLYEKENGYIQYNKIEYRYEEDGISKKELYKYEYGREPDGYPEFHSDELPLDYEYTVAEIDGYGTKNIYMYNSIHNQTGVEHHADGRMYSKEVREYDEKSNMPTCIIENTYNSSGNCMTVYNDTEFDNFGKCTYTDRYTDKNFKGRDVKQYAYSDGYHICIYESMKKDDNTLVEIKRNLSTDGKNVSCESIFENGVKIKESIYSYDTYGNMIRSSIQTDTNKYLITEYEFSAVNGYKYPIKSTIKGIDSGNKNSFKTLYEYDEYGNILSLTESDGAKTSYEYDLLNRNTKVVLPDKRERTNIYNDKENTIKTIDAEGLVLIYKYDEYGRLVNVNESQSSINLLNRVYDIKGRLVSEADANGTRFVAEYDGQDRYSRLLTLRSDGTILNEKTIEYDEVYKELGKTYLLMTLNDGNPLNSRKTQYLFDEKGNNIKTIVSDKNESRTTIFEYDNAGNIVLMIDNSGRETKKEYDIFGNVTRIIYPDGSAETFQYDFIGNQTLAVNAENESIISEYDPLGRQIRKSITTGNGISTYTNEYDFRNNPISSTDAKGNTTKYSYNERGFLLNVHQYSNAVDGIETSYEYDGEGRIVKTSYGAINTPKKHTYTYILDSFGRCVKEIDSLGKTVYTEYDNNGNVIKRTDRNGVVTKYTYDGLNRIVREENSKDGIREYSYDDWNNITSQTDGTNIYTYSYNGFGELTCFENGSSTEKYSYDTNGNMTSKIISDKDLGDIVYGYEYDIMNRVIAVRTPMGNELLSYDMAGRIKTKENSVTGIIKKYVYNPDGNIREVNSFQNNNLIHYEKYEYDKNGNKTYSDINGDISEYFYDGMNRLQREISNGIKTSEYEFDGFNNISKKYEWLGESLNTKTYRYDDNNRLIQTDDSYSLEQYNYDNEGNLIEKITGMGKNTQKSYYRYDGHNRLQAFVDDNTTAEYSYDLNNLRNEKTVNGKKTRYVTNNANVIAEIIDGDAYVYYRGTELLGSITPNGNHYYRTDSHGNVISLLDATGKELKSYKYNAYGEKDSISINPNGDNTILYQWKRETEDIYNPFGYCGEYCDIETGFIYLRNRYYDPETARFITEDPIKDGINWYAYCENNPVVFCDIIGLKPSGTSIYYGGNYNSLDAKIIQIRLNELGYTDKNGNKLAVDGSIGPNTTYAIKKYQEKNHLEIDGCVGDITWQHLGLILDTDITDKLYIKAITTMVENCYFFGVTSDSSLYEKMVCFYFTVRNRGALDLKQLSEWKSEYFIFDGKIVTKDAPGNIAYGIAGKLMGFSDELLLQAAGIAQILAGTSTDEWVNSYSYGDDPMDQFNIKLGINYYNKKVNK